MGMTPLPGVRVTLITRGGDTPYSGMLPGFIAGYYRHEECYIDLRRLAAFAGARLILDEAVGLDRERGQVMTRGHPPFRYDVLSIDIGSTPTIDNVPGAADFATPVKPIDRFEAQWSKILARLLKAEGKVTLALVGGGVGGVELAFAVRERLGALVRILLLTAGEPLPHLSPGPRRRVLHALQGRGIEVVGEAEVTGVEKGALVARDGRRFPYDELLWVTEARAAPWLAQTGLALDGQGFIA
ncbi:MAG TPA: FAD-dependent oxidoreductase, partial [Stellaceae bacterium]|nr:FAD-dependent oxidoreductase [Stellaceae bacterium]